MAGMKKDKDALPSISPAEWEVMKVLWAGGAMAARQVYAALPQGHEWAAKTVKTLLARLVAKGAVAYEQVGNSYLYRAAVSREEVTREEVKGFVDRVLGGSMMPLLAYFIEGHKLTEAELARLHDLIGEGEKPPKHGKGGRR